MPHPRYEVYVGTGDALVNSFSSERLAKEEVNKLMAQGKYAHYTKVI